MKRVLLDENLPRSLKRELEGFEVRTVVEVGWAGVKNGQLLRLAEGAFDLFVTADRNLPNQQNLKTLDLGVVLLIAGSTKLEVLLPRVPELREALDTTAPGQLRLVPAR